MSGVQSTIVDGNANPKAVASDIPSVRHRTRQHIASVPHRQHQNTQGIGRNILYHERYMEMRPGRQAC